MEKVDYSLYIDKYLSGDMQEMEKKWFEGELEINSVLKKEVQLYKEVHNAIIEKDIMDLRDKLYTAHDKVYTKRQVAEKKIINLHSIRLAAAAIIMALIGSSAILFFSQNRQYSNEQIFNKYFKPYKTTLNYRSSDAEINKLLRQAMLKYEDANYEEALVLFEKILNKNKNHHASNLYSGISSMEIKKFNKANQSFKRIINHSDNLFIDHAEWYLGFCYLMTDDRTEAIKTFEKIAKSNSYYQKKAREILKKLD